MRVQHHRVVATAVLLAAVATFVGCAGVNSDAVVGPSASGSVGATISALPSATVTTSDTTKLSGGPSAGSASHEVSSDELAALKKQLEAMQRELDSVAMPSDDFSDAEGAVY